MGKGLPDRGGCRQFNQLRAGSSYLEVSKLNTTTTGTGGERDEQSGWVQILHLRTGCRGEHIGRFIEQTIGEFDQAARFGKAAFLIRPLSKEDSETARHGVAST